MQKLLKLNFLDIKNTVQGELIAGIMKDILKQWEFEMTSELPQKWYVEPKTWQEEFVRLHAIHYSEWANLDEHSPEFAKVPWSILAEEEAYSVASDAIEKGFKNLVLEVNF